MLTTDSNKFTHIFIVYNSMKRRNIFRILLICYILTGGYTQMMATNSESNPVARPTPYCKQVLLCSPSDSE